MKKNKSILGLDLGSNSIGWALLNESKEGEVNGIIDLGSRIFNKAVEEKVPTPKNVKRRDMRLGRRVLQRRARRKQRMLNYLVSLELLPKTLQQNTQPEIILNSIGNPYELRVKGLDEQLSPYEFGRVLLHFVARRGFLSTKKQIAGDLIDDPDTQNYLAELDAKPIKDKDEKGFKEDISKVYQAIKDNNARTLGEYLFNLEVGKVKRNRSHDGGHLRTDRAMYKNELILIWKQQQQYFDLPKQFMSEVEKIIFYQRPLKLKKDRVGKCSLEKNHYRANTARLEVQKFRYLQIINKLKYLEDWGDGGKGKNLSLSKEYKQKLKPLFEYNSQVTIARIKKELGFERKLKFEGDETKFKGNITACEIRDVIGEIWDKYTNKQQHDLFEDLFTIKKKSALKARLITHWDFDKKTAVKLCLIEFEPSHSNHSLKAIKKLLPFLEEGCRYDEARVKADYGYEVKEDEELDKLPAPPETSNPIVNKGLQELKRVINALIKQHGKPDIIRIEMARDLEMNTKDYKKHEFQQNKNKKANEEATKVFQELRIVTDKKYPSHDEKIRYRLWVDQDNRCAYSGNNIALSQIFSAETQIDHILPFKKSLDDSYMNKVLCFEKENQNKKDRTPIDAWGNDEEKWNQITQMISRWKGVDSKVKRFYRKESETKWSDKGFSSSQLNDTRYISKLAQEYVKQLGCDVSVTKGQVVAQIRHQWGFNEIIGETDKKERTDHRHHTIDAVVIGATSRSLYQKATQQIKGKKLKIAKPYENIDKELKEKLKHTIVSHATHRKLSGALHEETGAGYVAKHSALVYRKTLNPDFTKKNALKIIDEQVKAKVLEHLEIYNKEAFNEENLKTLKLGKNLIKRVRVEQSSIKTTKNKTAEDVLNKTKFGVKDKSGKIFKYMSYGNNHHVEIIENIKTGKIKGEFVTMMEAHRRAMTGTKSAQKRGAEQEPIIKNNHGDEWAFLMALHINDCVSIENENGERIFYRVQKMSAPKNKVFLRLNTVSTIEEKETALELLISKERFNKYQLKFHQVNAIGYFINDKT
jgi:CRISPR-associated endonuclease Csn1